MTDSLNPEEFGVAAEREVSPVTVERVGASASILWVTIRNPPVNTLTPDVRSGLVAATHAAHSREIKIVVLCGQRVFSAGGDVKELASISSVSDAARVYREFRHLYESWAAIPVPTVAMVQGYALGGALELALSCDIRYAAPDAFLAASGVSMGLVESAHSLPRLILDSRAAEMLFTARRVEAIDAVETGLITGVYENVVLSTRRLADEISGHSVDALRSTKAVLAASRQATRTVAADIAANHWLALQGSEGHRAALDRFLGRTGRGNHVPTHPAT